MGDFGIILGLEYAKNRYFLQKKFHLMAVSGQHFDNYNSSIECNVQSHLFKVVLTTCKSFWTKLQTRYKLRNY